VTKMHMVGALNQALHHAMEEDPSVMLLGEDVGVDGGVFRVTDGLIDKYGADRVVDTPLAEAGIIGTAIGLAINGMKPIPEIQFSGFSYQAFHHIKQHMSRFRQRSDGTFTVPMVLRTPCSGGIRALEHHSESPEAFFIHCQGIKVVMPSGPYDAKGLLLAAIRDMKNH
jgi:pyruvate dehydrogenase E1 component beta subunit